MSLTLRPISKVVEGHSVEPLELAPPGPFTVGRSSEATWTIPDQVVSRRHALIERLGDEWFVTDLKSRHGTYVNGQRLAGTDRLPVRPGDQLRFGQWACRCQDQHQSRGARTTASDERDAASKVSAVGNAGLAGVAQQRLDALLDACRALQDIDDRDTLAQTLIRCAADGTNCRRVMLVQQIGEDEFEILATTDPEGDPRLSRSLLSAASAGRLAQLTGMPEGMPGAQSIIDLNIQTAICAPIQVGESVEAFLYLDTRGSERGLSSDAASFCQSLAQLGGLSLDALLRAEIEQHRKQMEQDLNAARGAQEMLMPERAGRRASVHYEFESSAGRMVAGDFFDVLQLDDERTAFFLGDVSGKGVGAALLMAAGQAKLRAFLVRGLGLADSLDAVNAFLFERTASDKFITLIAGIIDHSARTLELADAGHGLCCLCPSGKAPERVHVEGSLPIGVVADAEYASETLPFGSGDRVVVFSDGVVEQASPSGDQYGLDAVLEVLATSDGTEADVRCIAEAVRAHAAGPLADDLTVASLQLDD
jgi:serine phosphatase RsbU (regulator of sigma subunit)